MSNKLWTPKLLLRLAETRTNRVFATSFASTNENPADKSFVPFSGNQNVSYFVGIDARDTNVTSILGGDDHFLVANAKARPGMFSVTTNTALGWQQDRHKGSGNILLADGSVQQLTSTGLQRQLALTGVASNRWVLP